MTGYCARADAPRRQVIEVLRRFNLLSRNHAFWLLVGEVVVPSAVSSALQLHVDMYALKTTENLPQVPYAKAGGRQLGFSRRSPTPPENRPGTQTLARRP